MKSLFTILAIILPIAAFGAAAFQNKESAIRSAKIIAIVEILDVKKTEKKTAGWTYSEVATANVEKVLKGELPEQVKLYGGENFICAQVKYKPGRHMVFLQPNGELLTVANWHLGLLPIKGKTIEWFESDKSIALKSFPLERVVEEIQQVIANDWPILVHMSRGARSITPNLKFAYWMDGTVLSQNAAGQHVVGYVEYPQFSKMWTALRDAQFFSTERKNYLVFDVGYQTIVAQHGSQAALRSWNPNLKPRTPETANKSPEYLSFVNMWKKSAAAIGEIVPKDTKPVSEVAQNGIFRGFVVDNPRETEWLSDNEWLKRIKEN